MPQIGHDGSGGGGHHGEEIAVAATSVVVGGAAIGGLSTTDHTAPIVGFSGAIMVALLTAYTADRRQRAALDAEDHRHRAALDAENAPRRAAAPTAERPESGRVELSRWPSPLPAG